MGVKFLKGALTGAVIGTVAGPIVGGLVGFVLVAMLWLVQGLVDQLPLAALFGLLVAPVGGSVDVFVGLVVGGFDSWFGSGLNVGSFGGMVGSVIGLLTLPSLFRGSEGEVGLAIVAVIAMSIVGVMVAVVVKRVRLRFGRNDG